MGPVVLTEPCLRYLSAGAKAHDRCHRRCSRLLSSPSTKIRKINPHRQYIQAAALPELVQEAVSVLADPTPGFLTGSAVTTLVYIFGIKVLLRGLTWEGVISSWLLGALTYSAFGAGGFVIVCLYFLIGSKVTKIKLEQKQKEGIAEARSGRRGLGSVLGSGFAGAACALLALLTGNVDLWRVGFAASFASKLADTTSSEIGKAYGKTTYLITSLERVPRGTEGAVSLEGTLAGLAAAAFTAGIAVPLQQVSWAGALCVVVAAFVANIAESYLGAVAQSRVDWLSNDVVNILQITLAAGLGVGLAQLIGAV